MRFQRLTVIRHYCCLYQWEYARGFLQGVAPDVDAVFVACFGVVTINACATALAQALGENG
jgi:hypothetical protein